MPVQFTTEIPDGPTPSLDNGIEDEITASWTDVSNYGDYRVQIRETGQSSWSSSATGFAEAVVDEATSSHTFTGLEDGEEYEVRLRPETEHVQGGWSDVVAITTAFPTPTSVTVDSVGTTSVTFSWTDQADNEDGFRLQRRRQYEAGWGRWQTVATAGPDTETATDDTALPGRDYQYRVEVFTEDATNASDPVAVTTDAIATTERPIATDSWSIEIDHPNKAQPIRPDPLEGVEFRPTINGLPRVRIPVRRAERWDATNFEHNDMRVWYQGRRLPIDTLVDVEQQPERTVLVGRGGQALMGRVTTEVQQQEAHLAAEDIVQDETPYLAHVDDPSGNVSEDLLQGVGSQEEWEAALPTIPAEKPIEVDGAQLKPQQTLYFRECEDTTAEDISGVPNIVDESRYNGGEAMRLSGSGDFIEIGLDVDYPIPIDDLRFSVRMQFPDSTHPAVNIYLNGNAIGVDDDADDPGYTIPKDVYVTGETEPDWNTFDPRADDIAGDSLSPTENYTVRFRIEESAGGDEARFDCFAVYDTLDRYGGHSYNFSENVTDGAAPGPELYGTVEQETALVNSAFGVVGARLDASVTDTSGEQQVAIRRSGASSWVTADNSATVEADFGTTDTAVQTRYRLGAYGSGSNTTPTQGDQPQAVDFYQLFADIDETPLLVGETFDAAGVEVLNRIADLGEFIWELVWDSDAEQLAVEWTKPGQRTTDSTADPSDYQASKSTAQRYREVVIRGAGRSVRDDTFALSHDTWGDVLTAPVVAGSVTITSADGSTTYQQSTDYELRRQTGEVRVLSSGNIADGETLSADYEYKVVGSAQTGDFDPATDQSLVRTVPGLLTEAVCEQAALFLLREVSVPQWRVSVNLTRDPGDRSLVEAREFAAVPSGGPKHVVDSTETPSGKQLQLANRREVSEAFSDLQERVEQISERV